METEKLLLFPPTFAIVGAAERQIGIVTGFSR